MKFTKMHGNGNDYVYIECFTEEPCDFKDLAKKISDRHFGVGGDGLIVAMPPFKKPRIWGNIMDAKQSEVDVVMLMYNADGSEGNMCGNGIRCLSKLVYDNNLVKSNPMKILTKSGIKTVELVIEDNLVNQVKVDMGSPIITPSEIPYFSKTGDILEQDISLIDDNEKEIKIKINAVSMGNPHCIIFLNRADKAILDRLISDRETVSQGCIGEPSVLLNYLELNKFGSMLESHPDFPERTNVEFVEILSNNHIALRVFERGGYETLSCGTGCCAAVAAGIMLGVLDKVVKVDTIGGSLTIEWDGNPAHSVFMTGPATTVFTGEYIE